MDVAHTPRAYENFYSEEVAVMVLQWLRPAE